MSRAGIGLKKGIPITAYFSKLPAGVPELRFAYPRRWRFDLAWPAHKVAVEQEGGIWIQGRHSRGKGMLSDMAKYNEAQRLGWKIFRFTPQQVRSLEAETFMLQVIRSKG